MRCRRMQGAGCALACKHWHPLKASEISQCAAKSRLRCVLCYGIIVSSAPPLLLPSADYGTTPDGVQDTTTLVDGSYHDEPKTSSRRRSAWLSCLLVCNAMPMPCHVRKACEISRRVCICALHSQYDICALSASCCCSPVSLSRGTALHDMHAMPCQYVVRRDEWRAMSGNAARRRRVSTCSSRVRLDVCACSVYERAV